MAKPQIPQKIGKYTIAERIGRGGMGYVYRATDPLLKRDIALKTMLKDVSEDPELRTRFIREAQSAGGLRHPNIVTIYDLGEDDEGCPFIAMEFLTGTDLEHIIKNRIDMDLQKKLDVVIQTAMGLDYAHKNGIVHRDIKPANIRVLENGEIKIMDFGIAKMTASRVTRTGMIMGTPHYMAPEQIRGETVDRRADIFSLGVVLYELLAFRKPFSGDNPTTVLFKIIHSDPDPLADGSFTPPEGLEECILKALDKNQDTRYQTCEEMAQDLIGIYASLEPLRPVESSGTPLPHYAGRTPLTGLKRPGSATPPPTPSPASSTDAARIKANETRLAPASTPGLTVGSAPTAMQPQTLATASPVLSVEEPVIDGSLTPPTSSPAPVAVKSQDWKKWILLGAGGIVLLIVGLFVGVTLIRKIIQTLPGNKQPAQTVNQPEAAPVQNTPSVIVEQQKPEPAQTPVAVPVHGSVSLNILPWAEIQQIKKKDGSIIPAPVPTTPCMIQLEIGTYEITLANPRYQPLIVEVEVKENAVTLIHQKMRGFNDSNAIDSLGL